MSKPPESGPTLTKTPTRADGFDLSPKPVTLTTSASTMAAPEPPQKKGSWDKVGDAIGGAAKAVGNAVTRAGGGVVDAVVGVGKDLAETATIFGGGVGDLFTGHFGDGLKKLGRSLVKVVQTPVDAVLMAGGSAVSAVQLLLGIEPPGRKLTADEHSTLESVYGDTIDYDRVRIKEGNAGVLTLSGRAFTHGDTLYIPRGELPLRKELLVHESAHVWQHQHGGTGYMIQSLWAQAFGDAYDYGKALAEGKTWADMDPEQQAQLIMHAYGQNLFNDPNARFYVNGKDYTAEVRAAIALLRAGRGAP